MKVFIRGAKCVNRAAKASRSFSLATAAIRAAHLAASDVASSGLSFSMQRERSHSQTVLRGEYRIAGALARVLAPRGCCTAAGILPKRIPGLFGSPVIQTRLGIVFIHIAARDASR
ncbi:MULTISPECIES: hypothetical protein [unclassified Bradyrhizobium]|uniref:hypothetical protein n=1 Tax=unclassified Bradyrhizobium TaxID=2631580 RepID=UPI00201398C9|nr:MULTISPECIES: hypothetical protein [unclassified Bradyrhizobium]